MSRPCRAVHLLAALLLASASLLLVAPVASAHVPLVGGGERSIDASRSWAFYEELDQGETDAWTFDLEEGDRLFIAIGTLAMSSWTPTVTLDGPSGPITLTRVDKVSLEPFTPYSSRDSWSLDAPAPATGDYVLRIGGDGGAYVLGFGLRESFTPLEWLTIPWQALLIHDWEGQPGWWLALPYALAVAIAFLYRPTRGDLPAPLTRVAAALMLASGLERTAQLILAWMGGARGPASGFVLSAVLAIVPMALAWGMWRSRRPLAFVALALGGALAWAGLVIGPALALLQALVVATRDKRLPKPGVSP